VENKINIRIEAGEEILRQTPFLLQYLERDLQRELDHPVQREAKPSPEGTMSGEIISAIELAGLAITTLGTIWTILQIRYRGQISIEKELADGSKVIITKANLTDELKKLEDEARAKKLLKFILKLGGK
jgi:hypothetical protein